MLCLWTTLSRNNCMPICHIFVLVPIIMIAPSSQARLRRKRKAVVSSQWHLVACGACQGYPETQESEIPEESAWPASVGCTRPQPAFFPLQIPSNANSSSAASAFAGNCQEDLCRNPTSSLARGRQGLQPGTAELTAGHQLLIHSGSGSICVHEGRGKARHYKLCM